MIRILSILLIIVICGCDTPKNSTQNKETLLDRVEQHLKERLNNPSSYQYVNHHIDTLYYQNYIDYLNDRISFVQESIKFSEKEILEVNNIEKYISENPNNFMAEDYKEDKDKLNAYIALRDTIQKITKKLPINFYGKSVFLEYRSKNKHNALVNRSSKIILDVQDSIRSIDFGSDDLDHDIYLFEGKLKEIIESQNSLINVDYNSYTQ